MKPNLFGFALAAAVFTLPVSACAQTPAAAPVAEVSGPQTYKIDPAHTSATFHINHFGFSTLSGKFTDISGEIIIDEANPAASSVSVTIPMDKVMTGVEKFDAHLKTDDFFNVAEFPTATFVSTDVILTDEDSAKVTGDLTLHGVTKEVVLDVDLNQIGKNGFDVQTAGFSASTTIVRSQFGINTYVTDTTDEVRIEIQSEANL